MRLLLSIFSAMLLVQSANAQGLWRNSATTNRTPWVVSGSTNIVGTITNPIANSSSNYFGSVSAPGGFTSAASNYFGTVQSTNILDPSNVKYWGAKGDGVTDDTDPIREALQYATNGGTVFLPSGTYLISGGLFIGARGLASIIGEGFTSILQCTNQTGAVINISTGPGDFQYGQRFENFQIKGDNLSDATLTNAGIFCGGVDGINGGVTGISFRNIIISETGGPGITLATETDINLFENITLFRPVGADTNDVPYMRLIGTVNNNKFENITLRNNSTNTDAASGSLRLELTANGSRPEKNLFSSITSEYIKIPENGSIVSVKGSDNVFYSYADYDSLSSETGTTNTSIFRFQYDNIGGVPYGNSYGNIYHGELPGATGSNANNIAFGLTFGNQGDSAYVSAGRYSMPVQFTSDGATNYVEISGLGVSESRMGVTSWIVNRSGYDNQWIEHTMGSMTVPKIGAGLALGEKPNTSLSVFAPFVANTPSPMVSAQNGGVTLGGIYGIRDNAGPAFGLGLNTYKLGVGEVESVRIANSGSVGIGTTNPLSPLHVTSIGGAGLILANSDYNGTSTGSSLAIYPSASSGDALFEISALTDGGTAANSISLQPSSGKVGIGISSPQTVLNISGAALANYGTTVAIDNRLGESYGLTAGVRNWAQSGFSIENITSNTIPLTITKTDNVGINTLEPVAKLDVTGDIRASTTITATNGFYTPSNAIADGGFTSAGSNYFGVANVNDKVRFSSTNANILLQGSPGITEGTNGGDNVFIGAGSGMANTTGYRNASLGGISLEVNTLGYYNTALGHGTMRSNVNGYHNTAVGGDALNKNVSGSDNTAIGIDAMLYNVSGSLNTAIGFASSLSNISGTFNVGIGHGSLLGNLGSNNVAIGASAGGDIRDASDNTFIGYQSGYQPPSQKTDVTNSTAIGAYTFTSKNNQVVIGSGYTTETVLRGNVGINEVNPTAVFHVLGAAKVVTNSAGVSPLLSLVNSYASGDGGSSLYFKGYYDLALISAHENPMAVTGGNLQLQTYSADGVLNYGINLDRYGRINIGTNTAQDATLTVGGDDGVISDLLLARNPRTGSRFSVSMTGNAKATGTITATNGLLGGNLTEGNYLAVGANGLIINTNPPEARIVGSTNKLDTDLKSYTDTAKLNATNGLYAALKASYTPMTTNGHVAGTFTLGQFQRTNTAAAITITSLTGATGSDALSGVLVISNSAATSQLITWPAEWINNLGYVSAYCTNAECMIISVNCLPGVMTNAAIVRTRKGAAGVAP